MFESNATFKSMCYEIKIHGQLDEQWSSWFNGMTISSVQSEDVIPETTLTVIVPDQSRLRGILNKIWDLNLTLISVVCKEQARG